MAEQQVVRGGAVGGEDEERRGHTVASVREEQEQAEQRAQDGEHGEGGHGEGGEGGEGGDTADNFAANFWKKQLATSKKPQDFRVQQVPVNRVKRIMRLDEQVKQLSLDAPIIMAKAAEFFIAQLTTAAWKETTQENKRVIQPRHIRNAAKQEEQYDFLVDILNELIP
ncbi:hypothetical protein PTSG_07533 [Salpingoeca rosetta]|uniref:Transcription factor CBF/NF-Y/archaeal histone domain-containing protein n=1 Tax=Salpingoeca rosetta (strain ATCC 50818 / BSB-021) TaxID=946362 RepID=F2UH15_SALR5|nr:uncharacterized protein PTSG_07533 [Salpingoeca rosetta]EGD76414.1 hypothetical protein PTSG_07533 [Salpingoeca rosetta]|eukprot:XP_004991329.1 hypothetical protein PTSG_07533 [Salpingoeca rosetta]